MKQQYFESKHQSEWQQFEQLLDHLEQSQAIKQKNKSAPSTQAFSPSYRHVCHHLALAQERQYSPYLIDKLNDLALRGHQQLYRHKTRVWHHIIRFIVSGFPQMVRKEYKLVLLSAALLYLPTIIMGLIVFFHPYMANSVLDPSQIAGFVEMYEPESHAEASDNRSSADDLLMFGFYIRNNIGS